MLCWASWRLKSLMSCNSLGSLTWSRQSRTQFMKYFSPGGKIRESASQKRVLNGAPSNQYLGMSPSRPKFSFSRGTMGCWATGWVMGSPYLIGCDRTTSVREPMSAQDAPSHRMLHDTGESAPTPLGLEARKCRPG